MNLFFFTTRKYISTFLIISTLLSFTCEKTDRLRARHYEQTTNASILTSDSFFESEQPVITEDPVHSKIYKYVSSSSGNQKKKSICSEYSLSFLLSPIYMLQRFYCSDTRILKSSNFTLSFIIKFIHNKDGTKV